MKLFPINAGDFYCDGGAIFGVVPKKVWQKRYPCTDDNLCKLSMRCLLVDIDDKLILIDTGCGNKQMNYLRFFNFKESVNFEDELQRIGYSCAAVTDVVLTHLHFDHCGGCTYYDDKELKLTFPNATHWVGEQQWQNYLNPNVREGNSYFPENMMPVHESGQLKLLKCDTFLSENVELRLYDGHSLAQIAPYINNPDTNEKIVYVGDVIPLAAALPVAWVAAYDIDPIASMKAREKLLKEAAANDFTLFFEHDAYVERIKVKDVNGKYLMKSNL